MALILIGSRGQQDSVDQLSDYDISVFCQSSKPYTQNHNWLSTIGKVWVVIPEKLEKFGEIFPTRLVIFDHAQKVDFAFFSEEILKKLSQSNPLPDDYRSGYKVLIDKTSLTKKWPSATYDGFLANKPSKETFLSTVEEFWFEIFHVAKYLKRKDLWPALFRLSEARNRFFMQMVQWYEQSHHNWNYLTHPLGKNLGSWAQEKTYNNLTKLFCHFDAEEIFDALSHMMSLFRTYAKDVAKSLNVTYPKKLDQNISQFVEELFLKQS